MIFIVHWKAAIIAMTIQIGIGTVIGIGTTLIGIGITRTGIIMTQVGITPIGVGGLEMLGLLLSW